jgi:hypothetical protein
MSTIDHPPKPKRRWYQFSLLTLMLAVTLFTVGVGGIGSRMYRARQNRDRVAAVEEAVVKIEKLRGHVITTFEERRPQTWLEEQFDDPGGPDNPVSVLKVTEVKLPGTESTDAALEHLTVFTELTDLRLGGLWRPENGQRNVTDAGLEHLKGLTNLRYLVACGTKIGDAGLGHLKGLTNLRGLAITDTNVTDAGLKHLTGLTNVQGLFLNGTKITDAGLLHLKGMTKLNDLNINDTKITDVGMEHLKGLTNLQTLNLRGTEVTDAGLEHLKALSSLKKLVLYDTNVTDAGVRKFQQVLPHCKIWSPFTISSLE